MIRNSEVARLKAEVSLAGIIGETLALKRARGLWKGCCLFHAERDGARQAANGRSRGTPLPGANVRTGQRRHIAPQAFPSDQRATTCLSSVQDAGADELIELRYAQAETAAGIFKASGSWSKAFSRC